MDNFNQIILYLSQRFINCPLEQLYGSVAEALGIIGEYCGAQRIVVFRYNHSTRYAQYMAGWHCAGGEIPTTCKALVPFSSIRPMLDAHHKGNVYRMVDDEQKLCENLISQPSCLAYPCAIEKGAPLGCVIVTFTHRAPGHNRRARSLLRLFARMLTIMLVHAAHEQSLSHSNDVNILALSVSGDGSSTIGHGGFAPNADRAASNRHPTVVDRGNGKDVRIRPPANRCEGAAVKETVEPIRAFDAPQPFPQEQSCKGRYPQRRANHTIGGEAVVTGSLPPTAIDGRQSVLEQTRRMEVLQKEAEILREKEREYLEFLDGASDGSWIFDFKNNLLNLSHGWHRRLDVPDKPLPVIDYVASILHKRDRRRFFNEWTDAVHRKLTKVRIEFRVKARYGGAIWILAKAKIVYDADGRPLKIYGTSADITETKRAENTVHQQNRIFSAINEIYEASHRRHTFKKTARACLGTIESSTQAGMGFIGVFDEDGRMCCVAYSNAALAQWAQTGEGKTPDCLASLIRGVQMRGQGLLINKPLAPCECADAKTRPVVTSLMVVPYLQQGQVKGVVGVANRRGGFPRADREVLEAITPTVFEVLRRKKAEEEANSAQSLLRAVIDGTTDAIYLKDRRARILMANAAFLETNGLSPDTLDKDVTQYRAHSGAQAMLDADLRVMENNLPEQVEELVVDAGGKARTLLTSKVPWHDENGKVIGLIGIARDISERKRMEDQLRESEELLRSVIENTSDTILLKDRHGRVLMANSAYLVANGVAFEDIEAKSAKQYHPDPSFGQRFLKEDLLVIHTNRARAFEATLPMPDGKRTRTMLVSKSPWRNDKGEAIGVICIAHNITRRKEMERTLRKTAEDLAQKNRLITDFFTNISHELKTPLAIILVQLELMVLNAQNSDKICALAASATQNAFRLSRLVDNLLDITRIDGGHMPIDLVDVDAVSLIRNIVETVKVYAHEKDIIVRFASSVREKIMPFDIEKTERIMFNLLSNAIKFTPSGGRITVRVQDRGEAGVAISVSDTGIGIPSDKLFAIFDRFEQVDSSMSKQNEGCGIGLSLVKALVQLLGGTIEVKSRINRGSRFIVTLPICSALHRSTRTKFHSRDLAKKAEVELSDLSL